MNWKDFFKALWSGIKSNVLFFVFATYWEEEKRVADTKLQAQKTETDLEVSKANEAINAKYADKSDVDVVRDGISNGGGDPTSITATSPSNTTKPKS